MARQGGARDVRGGDPGGSAADLSLEAPRSRGFTSGEGVPARLYRAFGFEETGREMIDAGVRMGGDGAPDPASAGSSAACARVRLVLGAEAIPQPGLLEWTK